MARAETAQITKAAKIEQERALEKERDKTETVAARASSQNAPSSLTIYCRAHRTGLTISTTGPWKQATGGEVKVIYRINEEPSVEQRWIAAETGKVSPFQATSFASCAQCRIVARFSLRCTLVKARRMKVRFNLAAWILSDVRSRQRATGTSPNRSRSRPSQTHLPSFT
jgi:hypothetical protein